MAQTIALHDLDPAGYDVPDPLLIPWTQLFHHGERLAAENERLCAENLELKRELAKLKKQSPPPKTKPNKDNDNESGKKNSGRRSGKDSRAAADEQAPRNGRIHIDREQEVRLGDEQRPADFRSTGFRDVVVQNIILKTDTVKYRLERGYSASTGEFYEATLPDGVKPGYGAELEAMVLHHYFQLRVPQPKIHQLLTDHGIVISTGQISNILTKKYAEMFDAERQDVLLAGLCATEYQQIDDTGMRVDGVGHYVTTLCSPYYSCFFTRRHKNADTVETLISEELDDPNATLRDYVFILLGDDAGQFHNQTEYRGLCWIHEERLYKKLRPYFTAHRKLVDDFRGEIWDYYDQLKAYKERPTKKERRRLARRFDELFGRTTGYEALDHRIALTRAKKEHLLLVLQFPDLPLENNESERSLREWVIKRHISRGTRSLAGTRAWDVNLSLCDTARKVGQNYYEYLVDRISGSNRLPSLAERIFELSGVPNPELQEVA